MAKIEKLISPIPYPGQFVIGFIQGSKSLIKWGEGANFSGVDEKKHSNCWDAVPDLVGKRAKAQENQGVNE